MGVLFQQLRQLETLVLAVVLHTAQVPARVGQHDTALVEALVGCPAQLPFRSQQLQGHLEALLEQPAGQGIQALGDGHHVAVVRVAVGVGGDWGSAQRPGCCGWCCSSCRCRLATGGGCCYWWRRRR